MKSNNAIRNVLALTAVAASLVTNTIVSGAIVDLTTVGSSGMIGGATFRQMDQQPTGTGVIDPFVRIQNKGNEAAYNTSGYAPNFDQVSPGSAWQHDLLRSSIQTVTIGGVQNYQFLLDINQDNGNGSFLSLNQLQIFTTSTPGQTGGNWNRTTDGRLVTAGLTGLALAYDMNLGGGIANGVRLDYSLNSGSGSGDMYLYVPTSAFGSGSYIFFYSQFGAPPGSDASNDGFEEWAVMSNLPVPEPTTLVAGALLLVPFGASTLRMIRRNRAA